MKQKTKTAFFCQNCGAEAAKWIGKCPSCAAWNTYAEEVLPTEGSMELTGVSPSNPVSLEAVPMQAQKRIRTGQGELDRVLGGGVVPGSLVLVGGEPGIGKSTLLLQMALSLGRYKVLYVSGEESAQQLRLRAERLGELSETCFVLTETSLQHILQHLESLRPDFVIIDSIQTLHSAIMDATAGSISQVRVCTLALMQYAKHTGVPIFLIGHINKEGMIAGPKTLEHMVDTVLQFEGDKYQMYRMLRVTKNRFGSTRELGIYEMGKEGLIDVTNPSKILLSQATETHSGTAIGAVLEGHRPLLIEVQSLVGTAVYSTPQRTVTGLDPKRLHILLALLERRSGFLFGAKDVFVNLTGGIKVEDPALDLAICVSLISSIRDRPLSADYAFAGEVGLGGEIRPVHGIEQRIQEVEKLGLKRLYLSSFHAKEWPKDTKIQLKPIAELSAIIQEFFDKKP